ncbi:MAG: DnaJ C-terminal domain-containing protein, partial [Phycisphaerales bacterium]
VIAAKCPDCRGSGRVSIKRSLSIKIPPGIHDRQAVRVTGEGEPPSPELNQRGEGIRGDLHVVVRVASHKTFEREGDDLLIAIPVTFTQAALGAEIELPTLQGTTTLKIPPGTQHGALFRVNGEGLPNLRGPNCGDLVVIVQLIVPRKLSESQKKLLQEYAHVESLEVSGDGQSLWDKIKDAVKGT